MVSVNNDLYDMIFNIHVEIAATQQPVTGGKTLPRAIREELAVELTPDRLDYLEVASRGEEVSANVSKTEVHRWRISLRNSLKTGGLRTA